ncbi:MAG TPA: alpha/beta family hydrolase [Acidimicrobiales bacterium]|nr:alpha/beta family hydrolase [Acidimicrobiales bacterium]
MTDSGPVAGKPSPIRPTAIVLTPGAGASSDHPTLVALDTALSARGIAVLRIDFPYRLAGRRAPDRPAVLVETVRSGALGFAEKLGVGLNQVALGGRSMGGRMCSIAASEGLPTAGLVLISYPLHPPGHPDRPRTAHFPAIKVPCLFVSGDRDPFGSPDELQAATRMIVGPVTHAWLTGGDHGLRRRDESLASIVVSWLIPG